jgi:transposase
MNGVVANYAERQIHVILDNLNTHKPKQDRWLKRHPNVHLHFTPTYASWLNQVEVWFSMLSRGALRGASFTDPRQVRSATDAFTIAHNEHALPFEWTKSVVYPGRPQELYR